MSESHTPESIWEDPRITAYVLGELPEGDRVAFESEMESDSELAAAVEEARSVTGQLEGLYATEPTAGLDDQRREAIVTGNEAIVAGNAVFPARDDSRSWKIPALVLVTAATLLLLVGVAPWLTQDHDITVTQVENPASAGKTATTQERSAESAPDNMGSPASVAVPGALEEMSLDAPVSASADKQRSLKSASEPRQNVPATNFSQQTTELRQLRSNRPVDEYVATAPAPAAPAGLSKDQSVAASPSADKKNLHDGKISQLSVDASKENAGAEGDSRVIGDVQIEMVPELGTIVIRGEKRDVERVQKAIEQTEAEGVTTQGIVKMRDDALAETKYQATREKSELAAGLAKDAVRGRYSRRAVAAEAKLKLSQTASSGLDAIGGGGFGGGADYGLAIDEARGPGIAGDRFEPITDNPFKRVSEHPLSTFSVDVDTASYSKVRDFLMRAHQLPRPDAVRIEEMLNYFDYDYQPPSTGDDHPFAARAVVTSCPWNDDHRLARIALKGKTMDKGDRPPCNLVFLLDTSGSMNAPNKLPLVIEGMRMLIEQLNEQDKVAITVYAGSAGLVLDSTSAKKSKKIRKALTQLSAGGSTNGGAGIALAYQTARENFIAEGVNRVILCTDGDFNVGTTGTDALVRMVEDEAKGGVFLSVLGFGMGNHNDAMLEKVSGRGNGNYAFIDTQQEARKVLVDQTSGTLVTIAKDVKLQIEFNPNQVSSYRLIGYENRILAKEDFNDDKKDAGEIGAGHAVTALYEIVPAGMEPDAARPEVDDLKYQAKPETTAAADSGEMMTLKLRYKQPDGDTSTLVEFPVADEDGKFEDAKDDVRFAAAVASFGMQLRRSEYAGDWTLSDVMNVANRAKGQDKYGLRAEFVQLVQKASQLMGEE